MRAAVGLGSTIDSSHFDRTCKPCDDFFQFVNGGWIAKNPIPSEYPWWGSYLKMRDDVRGDLREILERTAASGAKHGTDEQKLGDFYATCMDATKIASAGVAPIRPLLDLASNATAANLPQTLAQLHASGVDAFFDLSSTPDWKNNVQTVAFLGQSGLGLPDRDYYTRTDDKSTEDADRFNARAQCLVDQWNALEPLPGLHENGKQTLGENIADLGGVTIAYKAFERWQAHHPRRTIDGFTPEQRFFVGYAVSHLAYATPEFTRFLTQADVHGFDKFRVNAAVADLPEFAEAFGCVAGDKEVRAKTEQCRIW